MRGTPRVFRGGRFFDFLFLIDCSRVLGAGGEPFCCIGAGGVYAGICLRLWADCDVGVGLGTDLKSVLRSGTANLKYSGTLTLFAA